MRYEPEKWHKLRYELTPHYLLLCNYLKVFYQCVSRASFSFELLLWVPVLLAWLTSLQSALVDVQNTLGGILNLIDWRS